MSRSLPASFCSCSLTDSVSTQTGYTVVSAYLGTCAVTQLAAFVGWTAASLHSPTQCPKLPDHAPPTSPPDPSALHRVVAPAPAPVPAPTAAPAVTGATPPRARLSAPLLLRAAPVTGFSGGARDGTLCGFVPDATAAVAQGGASGGSAESGTQALPLSAEALIAAKIAAAKAYSQAKRN